MQQNARNRAKQTIKWVALLIGALVVLGVAAGVISPHVYVFVRVNPEEVGVRFRGGRIRDVVGSGVYSDLAWFARIEKISIETVTFSVSDPEVITKDSQRIGLEVSGDIFRPDYTRSEMLISFYPRYHRLYKDDEALRERVSSLARQAMKACVGDRTFNENVIGASRDQLRLCIDASLDEMASEFGLIIKNVTVPNVILSAEAQASLDAITQSRLDTELAQQDTIKAKEQAAAEQARQEGQIRAEMSRQQEQARQQATLAQLEQERLQAERAVIEARKANELLEAERDLEINQVQVEAKLAAARAALAQELVLAELYAGSPSYAYLQAILANASALTELDKIIFTEEGTTPTIVVPGAGIMPTVDTGGASGRIELPTDIITETVTD
jgi:hypothetical protein